MPTTTYNDEAVILAERPFGTADKILTLFTKERGLVKAAAYGCRRPHSPLAGGMQPLVEIAVTLSEGAKVDTVRQYSMLNRHAKITAAADLLRFAYAALLCEAAAVLLPEQSPEAEIYETLTGALAAAESRNPQIAALAAIVQILHLAGWGVEVGGELKPLVDTLVALDWQRPPSFSVRRRELDAAEAAIVKAVCDLTGGRLKSYDFLKQIK